MAVAQRLLPDNTNGSPPYDAITWQAKANTEIMALWRYAKYPLTSVSGTNAILASSDTTVVAAISSYQAGMGRSLVPANTNTGGVSINIDSVGVVNLKDADGATLIGGALVAGRMYGIEYDGASWRVVAGGTNAATLAFSVAPDAIFRDEKTVGTDGGTTTATAFARRTLNTTVRNAIAGCSLSSSQITLQAGTYVIEWSAPAYLSDFHLSRLFNATDSTTVETGTSEFNSSSGTAFLGVATKSIGLAVVTITSAKAFEIDHSVGTSRATSGFGRATSLGAKEVYSWVNIWKVGTLAASATVIPGGGITFLQTFSTTTADADPGNGTIRLNNATQNAATQCFVDLLADNGSDLTALLDTLDASTSAVRGQVRITKYDDPTKWLTFNLTARTTASGYRKFTLVNTASSAASPFANGDKVYFEFSRTGDSGGGVATEAQAEAGTDNSVAMSPQGVSQAILTNSLGFANIAGRAGGFEVWQRGILIDVPASTTAYTCDGWYCKTGANQASQVAQEPGITNGSRFSALIIRNAGQTGTGAMVFAMPLDSDEIFKCRGHALQLIFTAGTGANWSPASGTLSYGVFFGTGAAPAKRNSTPYTGDSGVTNTVNIAPATATQVIAPISAAVPTNATQGEILFFWTPVGTAGAADWISFDDLDLRVVPTGLAASKPSFERSDYVWDLQRCLRHLYVQKEGAQASLMFGGAVSATNAFFTFISPVRMRKIPTCSVSAATDFSVFNAATNSPNTCNGVPFFGATGQSAAGVQQLQINPTTAGGLTAGSACALTGLNANAALIVSAEI